MKGRKIIFAMIAAVLTAAATGYASEAAIGYQPPTVETVEAAMPATKELALREWNAGLAVSYTNQQGSSNVGLKAVAVRSIGDLWGWRLSASVNGLATQAGFDRYGTAMTGPVINLRPFYAFMQVGAACNPSAEHKIGIAADTGAGLAFDIGSRSRIFVEAVIDAVPSGKAWLSTFGAGIGYAVYL